ncbi:Zinc finger, C2H2 [Ceraceosorus bombacis]|uniref:Zinc finger, C2H2 n=1 Tax=Ceraceosorus bombacis TaxID=401625 RepID=A0A0P1BHP0_9BASI|nr:Zinc finger, C2H2 [Ceraceosorus bombacis]
MSAKAQAKQSRKSRLTTLCGDIFPRISDLEFWGNLSNPARFVLQDKAVAGCDSCHRKYSHRAKRADHVARHEGLPSFGKRR